MARTSITTARYNPFTMEELYSPVLRATEQHLKQQEKYDELANQMNVWKYRLPQNSEARALYDNYEKMFNAAVDDLNANGINNPSARDNARALIRENPIPAFIETQKQLDQINDTANKLNPTTTRWLHKPTFDDVLHGNTNMDYVDLNDIEKKASDTIASVARTITQEPAFKKATGAGGQYFNVASTTGITDAMWQMAERKKQGESSGNKDLDAQLDRLNNAVTDIRTYSRIDEFPLDTKERNDVQGAIDRGLLTGSAITSYGVQRDNSDEMALRWANYGLSKAGQDAQMYLHGMVPNGKGGYTYGPSVATKVAGSGGNGTKTPKGPQDPYSVHSIDFDEHGNMVLNAGNYGYTSPGSKKINTYKNMEDFASQRSADNLVVPTAGWDAQDLNKKLTTQVKGKDRGSTTVKEAVLNAYKKRYGIDYQTDLESYQEYYNALAGEDKQKLGSIDGGAYSTWYVQHKILNNMNVAIGRNSDGAGKPTTNWEIFMEEKPLGNTIELSGYNNAGFIPEEPEGQKDYSKYPPFYEFKNKNSSTKKSSVIINDSAI